MVMKFPIAKNDALRIENMATRPIATSARPMRPEASPGGVVPSRRFATQVAMPGPLSLGLLAEFIWRPQGRAADEPRASRARPSLNGVGLLGLGLGRPGEVHVLVASIE